MRDLIGWASWYAGRVFYVAMRNFWPFNYIYLCLIALANEHAGWGRILVRRKKGT